MSLDGRYAQVYRQVRIDDDVRFSLVPSLGLDSCKRCFNHANDYLITDVANDTYVYIYIQNNIINIILLELLKLD